ncbi:MAG: DUF6259 domain-containing protein [Spirochaetota bacterium]
MKNYPIEYALRVIGPCIAALCMLGGSALSGANLRIIEHDRSFTAVTERLEATFADGMIVHLVDRRTGEIIADKARADNAVPAGMGCLNNDIPSMSKLHVPWGSTALKQQLPIGMGMPNYRRPNSRSVYRLEMKENRARVAWTGLSNGKDFYPNDALTIVVGIDARGALTVQTSGASADAGVFGATTPLINIDPNATFILAQFGGMEFDRTTQGPALMPFLGSPFYEVPVMAFEVANSSVGMWIEDDTFRTFAAFFNFSGDSFGFSFEQLNLMPFEPYKNIENKAVKLDCFANGDWRSAMTPYRDWYRDLFKGELRVRDSITWARDINVIVDASPFDANALSAVAALFPKEAVMFHDWNARKPKFDTELPDWTPRNDFIEQVQRIRSFGFRTMAYVNTYCVNYNSAVWKKDGISEFFLTRKSSPYKYKGSASTGDVSDLAIGTINYAQGEDQFKGMKDGQIVYGDPLSKRWREYHANMMKWWNTTTGCDANYEDTAGTTGDFGNGTLDGLMAGQGAVAQMRKLQEINPSVPMASEYGPSAIAFAVTWALNYVQMWGNQEFRQYRLHRQHPVGAFLFGNRQWIPYIRSGNDFMRHLATGCSDALNGMGMMASSAAMQDSMGFMGHMVYRSRLFAELGLKPYFPDGRFAKHIRSMYKDKNGKLYSYYDDGKLQQLLGPDGKSLYGRIDGLDRIATELALPNWPLYADGLIFGLDPNQNYALFPRSSSVSTAIRISALPDGISLGKYYETPEGVFLELRSNVNRTGTADVAIAFNHDYKHLYVNDEELPFSRSLTLKGEFPLRMQAVHAGKKRTMNEQFSGAMMSRSISASGIVEANAPPGTGIIVAEGVSRKAMMYNNAQTDFLVVVPTADTSIVTYVQNKSATYGNGTIVRLFINGKLMREFDCQVRNEPVPGAKPRFTLDTKIRKWTVPLGTYIGRTVWITLLSDGKGDSNSDQQWWTTPILISDAAQKNEEVVESGKDPK